MNESEVVDFHAACINFFLDRRIEFEDDQTLRRISILAGELLAADDPLTARSL
jgi:hypothetical protein